MKNINKKEYAKLCFTSIDMQNYIEKETFEVVALNDGYYGVEKAKIKKDFCFGYGMYGVADSDDEKVANSLEKNAKTFEYFVKENIKDLEERIEILQTVLDANDMFVKNNRLYVIGICTHYNSEPLTKSWYICDSSYCPKNITIEEILNSYSNHTRTEYRQATKEEIKKILDAEKRQLENFNKRLNTWWKRYGAEKLNIWTYLKD